MPYYARVEPPATFSSTTPSVSSGYHRIGNSVITSRTSNPLLRSPNMYSQASSSNPGPTQQISAPSLAYAQPRIHPSAPTSGPRSIEEALDKLDAELEGHMQAEERKKKEREEHERKVREDERRRKEWEMKEKLSEERKKNELAKREEERKKREHDRQQQEEERKRREWELQEQERKRRQEEEKRRRKEAERLEEERKKREWEKQEEERKKREWEKAERERRKRQLERQEEERRRREEAERLEQERTRLEEEKRRQKELQKREEEKRRLEQQRKRREEEEQQRTSGAKGKEQTAIENLERLLSAHNPPPPPPRLSAVTAAPPSGQSPTGAQASPPYPWLSRGGAPPTIPPSGSLAERLQPPPLTPQTEFAREKQRQREATFASGPSPPASRPPQLPPVMQAAPKDGPQAPAAAVPLLREPPKLYQAFPRERPQPSPPLTQPPSTRGLLLLGKPADSDGAQFEEEPSELLPDGLANIMAMLDESIEKEEEMYNNQESRPSILLPEGLNPPAGSGRGSYLRAPDLVPATRPPPGHDDFGCSEQHASPPVLSRQGSLASPCSRTSSLNDEDDDHLLLLQRRRPPTPPHLSQKLPAGDTDYRHSDLAKLYGLPEQSRSERDEEEEEEEDDEEEETASCSPPPQRPHLHQTGVSSVFKSLATMLESQKYAYRGGPFGRPPPSALLGVKYSSSLSLEPDICRQQQQGRSPTSESNRRPPLSFSPTATTLDSKSASFLLEDKKLKVANADVWGDEETQRQLPKDDDGVSARIPVKEEPELTTISQSSLAELGRSCELMLSQQVAPNKSSLHKTDKVKEHKEKDRHRERGKEKKKHGHSSSSSKHEDRKDKKHRDKRKEATSSSSSSSSSHHSSSGHKRHKDGKSHKEKDRRILGDLILQSKEGGDKSRTHHHDADKKKRKSACGTGSTSEGELGEGHSKQKRGSESASSLGSTDFLKLKALSDGPPKELKIRLIKVESGDRETFIASEVEEKRIPLEEISVKNTASEIIRSCK